MSQDWAFKPCQVCALKCPLIKICNRFYLLFKNQLCPRVLLITMWCQSTRRVYTSTVLLNSATGMGFWICWFNLFPPRAAEKSHPRPALPWDQLEKNCQIPPQRYTHAKGISFINFPLPQQTSSSPISYSWGVPHPLRTWSPGRREAKMSCSHRQISQSLFNAVKGQNYDCHIVAGIQMEVYVDKKWIPF